MDFIEKLPRSQGCDSILLMVDRLSKYARFLPLSHPYTAKIVVQLFVKEVVHEFGFPKSIVPDWYKVFISKFWGEMFR